MTEKKVKPVRPVRPLLGFRGKVSAITYAHGIKIGMPTKDRYDPKHAMDILYSMTLIPAEDEDWTEVQSNLVDHVHQTIETMSEERLNYWREKLGLNEP